MSTSVDPEVLDEDNDDVAEFDGNGEFLDVPGEFEDVTE